MTEEHFFLLLDALRHRRNSARASLAFALGQPGQQLLRYVLQRRASEEVLVRCEVRMALARWHRMRELVRSKDGDEE